MGISAPTISASTDAWSKKVLVSVDEDAKANKKIVYYEYCLSRSKDTRDCNWQRTDTKNAEVSMSGTWYVFFRGVTEDGRTGDPSTPVIVKIDNAGPVVNKVNKPKLTGDSITVSVDATDEDSGITKYLFSLDGKNFVEGDKTYTFEGLSPKQKYTVYIKVVDGLGNEILVTEEIETAEDGETIEVPATGVANNTKRGTTTPDSTTPDNPGEDTPDTPDDPVIPPTPEEWDIPTISLEGVPASFTYGEEYTLPTSYDFGNDDGTVSCTVEGSKYTSTKDLTTGTHQIECVAKSNHNKTATAVKEVEIDYARGGNEELDGWIKLNLYYPEGSTNWEWRLGKEDAIRTGYNDDGWQDYTGPILVKIDDISNIYIRYDMEGETYIVAPNGKITVDIEPAKWSLNDGEETTVRISYDKTATTKEYRINKGEWKTYDGPFTVGPETLIEARASRVDNVYNNIGEFQYAKTVSQTDNAFISKIVPANYDPSSSPAPSVPVTTITVPGPDGNDITITIPQDIYSAPSALAGPTISAEPTTLVDEVTVTITSAFPGKIYYSEQNGAWKEYTAPFVVNKNEKIKAYYIREEDGKTSRTSTYYVENIKAPNMPYVKITTNPGKDLTDTVNSVDVTITGSDYDTLQYSLDGVIYADYTGSFTVDKPTTVYAKGINANGETIETVTIALKTPPVEKDVLDVFISADPAANEVAGLVNKTTVTINYDSRATKKYYKLNYFGTWTEYTGPFVVTSNATVYAYCTSANGAGEADYEIDYLTTGIGSPKISVSPTEPAPQVEVSISFHKNADKKQYKIDNGTWQDYTGPFYVAENSTVYAMNSDILGNKAESSKTIKNIAAEPNYVTIDKGSYYIIKLNYPDVSDPNAREYKWKENGTWKKYNEQGILLIKPEYSYMFNVTPDGVKVLDDKGNEVTFRDDYYLLDVPVSELSENLFMRWSNDKPGAPTIVVSPEDEPTKEVEVGIVYTSSLVKKQYKVVLSDGTDSGWLDYEGPFKVDKNSTIYAKGSNRIEIESKVATKKITNIDEIDPTIELMADQSAPKQKVPVSVKAEDNLEIDAVKYAKGSFTEDYFNENGELISNNSTVMILENGVYTFFAKDKVGHTVVQEIEITNVDATAPNITITNKTSGFGASVNIEIDYGDSAVRRYSIGDENHYVDYTGELTVNAKDYFQYANGDGSLTIYAKGEDEAENIAVVSEKIYNLDLDMPAAPVITSYLDYPLFTKDGFTVYDKISVSYDNTRDDIINYIDAGDGYVIYEGPLSIAGGTIRAKSVKKSTGLTREIEEEVNFPADSLPAVAHDGDPSTVSEVEAGGKNTFKVNTGNSSIILGVKTNAAAGSKVKLYGTDGSLVKEVDIVSANTSIRLPSGVSKIEIVAGASGLEISEVEVSSVVTKIQGDSIISILQNNNLDAGYYIFAVADEDYSIHLYTLNGDQVISADTRYGDAGDVGTANTYAENMVIVKVNGDYTINQDVTVGPYYDPSYGGPKGFMLYVTGKLTNNGTIDQRHGAYAEGQNVYLWKNLISNDYEYIPTVGAEGQPTKSVGDATNGVKGKNGSTAGKRALGGGGTGGAYGTTDGPSGSATSYSGGTGGGGSWSCTSGTPSNYGGKGGKGCSGGAGAGNPAGGTGGLLIIYSDEYENNGNITVKGASGESERYAGGASGGGSINIFTNQSTNINSLGTVIDVKYAEFLGGKDATGGDPVGTYPGGAGGEGTVNIGEIRNGQYYDLKDIIQQDMDTYEESVTKSGESILDILDNQNLEAGYHTFRVTANGETVKYSVHLYVLDGNQTITEDTRYGDAADCATGTTEDKMAKNMVIVKVNGDYTINQNVTVGPYYDANYGGPKGFMLYVTGKLINNGTIDQRHGAYAVGQDVYLWKNTSTNDYEVIPAVGGAGLAKGVAGGTKGKNGSTAGKRALGGGGNGGVYGATDGPSGSATSYSGGAGGGGSWSATSGAASNYGGTGGTGAGGGSNGAGNPTGGTGGLLIIYANEFENNGNMTVKGASGQAKSYGGGSSGGGSINIFTNQATGATSSTVVNTLYSSILGGKNVTGGDPAGSTKGGAGGDGTVNIGEIRNGQYYDLKEIIQQDIDAL